MQILEDGKSPAQRAIRSGRPPSAWACAASTSALLRRAVACRAAGRHGSHMLRGGIAGACAADNFPSVKFGFCSTELNRARRLPFAASAPPARHRFSRTAPAPPRASTVAVGSTARRKRNHEVSGTRRTLSVGMSPRSSTTMPKPPPCNSRSVTFSTCSRRPERAAPLIFAQGRAIAFAATHPQQAVEVHACRRCRSRIEIVAGIHQRAGFLAARGSGQRRQHHARASRRSRPGDFAQRSARQSSGESVERSHVRWKPSAAQLFRAATAWRKDVRRAQIRRGHEAWQVDGMEGPRMMNGERKRRMYFRFLFAYADRILRPGETACQPLAKPLLERLRQTLASLL